MKIKFCEETDTIMLNKCSCCSGAFTRIETREEKKLESSLDYFITDKLFLEHIQEMKIIPQQDPMAITSDHCPIKVVTMPQLHTHTHTTFHRGAQTAPSTLTVVRKHKRYSHDKKHIRPLPPQKMRNDWDNCNVQEVVKNLNEKITPVLRQGDELLKMMTPTTADRQRAQELVDLLIREQDDL